MLKLCRAVSVCENTETHLSESSVRAVKGENLSIVLSAVKLENHNDDQTGEISPIVQ